MNQIPTGAPSGVNQKENSATSLIVVDLAELVSRNLLTLICLPIIGGLIALIWTSRITPLYSATSLLQVDPSAIRAVREIDSTYQPNGGSVNYYNTQLQIMRSRKLATLLVTRLDLADHAAFMDSEPNFLTQLRTVGNWLPFISASEQKPELSEDAKQLFAISKAMSSIKVLHVPESSLFQLKFQSPDRQLSAQAANALADIYIEELLQARLDITLKASNWMTENLSTISGSLDTAESELQEFRAAESIVDLGGSREIADEEILDLTKRLREAQKKNSALQNVYEEINRAGNSPKALMEVSSLLIDPVVKSTADNYFAARDFLEGLERRYGKRHPEMSTARAKFETAERAYFEQLRLKAQGVRSEYQIAQKNMLEAERAVREAKSRIQRVNRKQFQHNLLQREVVSNRQLYDLFLSRFKETQSSSTYDQINARIADPAVPPRWPSHPRRKLALAVGLFFGLMIAGLLAIIREALRREIESVTDIEALTSVPIIGILPHLKRSARHDTALSISSDPKAPFSDSIRSIRAAIVLSDLERSWKTIAITSALPEDGKTTVSSSLAASLAHHDKVLILDADLRRPSVHKMFGMNRAQNGAAQVLAGQAALDECIVTDQKSGVDVLQAGRHAKNPALLLASPQFGELVKQLRTRYDYIIFDTPPVGATSDALQMVPAMDSYVLVCRAEKTPKAALAASLKKLALVKANLIGIALNDSRIRRGYGQYYSGYYGRY